MCFSYSFPISLLSFLDKFNNSGKVSAYQLIHVFIRINSLFESNTVIKKIERLISGTLLHINEQDFSKA